MAARQQGGPLVIRSIAAVLVLGLALVACGGGGTSAEPGNSTGGEAQSPTLPRGRPDF
jgi:hypothetical protein